MPDRILTCPDCKNVQLVAHDRSTIEIDECPMCHGVWLDRGELDKLIALSRSGRLVIPELSPYGEGHAPADDDE